MSDKLNLRLVDFVGKNDQVNLEDFSDRSQERINDALGDLTGTDRDPAPGGAGNIIVSQTRDSDEEGIFETIENGLDAAKEGDTVFIEPGTYTENVTIEKANLTLRATGIEESVIKGQVVVSSDGVTLDGFTVSPPAATGNTESEAIRVGETPNGVTITNNVVDGFRRNDPDGEFYGVDGINVFGGDDGTPIKNVTITNNEVRGLKNEDQGGVAGISIQGNVDGATVENNVLSDLGGGVTHYGFGVVIRGTGNHGEVPENVSVENNNISGVRSDLRDLFGVGLAVEADGLGYTFENNDVDNVELGVEIKTGATETTLTRNNFINDRLHLADKTDDVDLGKIIGDNSFGQAGARDDLDPNPALKNAGYEQVIFPDIVVSKERNAARAGVFNTIPGAINDGNTDPGDTIYVEPGTYQPGGLGLGIGSPDSGTDPQSAPKADLRIVGQGQPTIDSTVQMLDPGITFEGFDVVGEFDGFGVATFEPGVTVRDVRVAGVPNGIFLGQREDVSAENCLVESYPGFAMLISGRGEFSSTTGTPTVTNCTFDGSSGGGVAGVGIIETPASISGNTIRGHSDTESDGTGVAHYSGANVTIQQNRIENNEDGVYFGADADTGTATRNDIVDNGVGVENEASAELDATKNWWGDSSGPGAGTNATATEGPVDTEPWSTENGPNWNANGENGANANTFTAQTNGSGAFGAATTMEDSSMESDRKTVPTPPDPLT